jgi:hypothetical protein
MSRLVEKAVVVEEVAVVVEVLPLRRRSELVP